MLNHIPSEPNDKKSTIRTANPMPGTATDEAAKELYSFDLWSFHSFDHSTTKPSGLGEGAKTTYFGWPSFSFVGNGVGWPKCDN